MIKTIIPNPAKAQSLLLAAEHQVSYSKTIAVSEEATPIIIKEIYDSFLMTGEALMLLRGKHAQSKGHHRIILNELITLPINTSRPLENLKTLQELRRKILYDGYHPTITEAHDVLSLADACFPPLLEAVKKEVKK